MRRLLWPLAFVVTFSVGWAVAGVVRKTVGGEAEVERLHETVARLQQQVGTLQARLTARETLAGSTGATGHGSGRMAGNRGSSVSAIEDRMFQESFAGRGAQSRSGASGEQASSAAALRAPAEVPATVQAALDRFYKYLEAGGGEGRERWQRARELTNDLRAMGPAGVQALMQVLATGTDSDERRTAAWLLGSLQAPEALPLLRDVIGNDNDILLRRAAASALRQLQTPESIPVMEQLLGNPGEDRFVRLSAAYGLAELGRTVGVNALAQIFNESYADGRGRDMAFRALASLEDDRSVPFMRQVVASQAEPSYRLRAIRYLAAQGDQQSLPSLQMIMQSPAEQPSIRDAAAQAYRAIAAR
jgi:HEAT repeat protein